MDDDLTKVIPQRASRHPMQKSKARRRTPRRIDGLWLFAVVCWLALIAYIFRGFVH